jgi:hypothetical protein
MIVSNFLSNFFRGYQYFTTTTKNGLFNTISLEPDQKKVIFNNVAEVKSPIVFERKLNAFFKQFPMTHRVAIIGNSIFKSIETVQILESKIKQLAHRPTMELINIMELSAMDQYYDVAYNSNYLKILTRNRIKDLKISLRKQKVSADLVHLNIIPICGRDYSIELLDYIKKEDFQLVVMNESSFEDLKYFLGKGTKNSPNNRKFYKPVFVV